MLQLHSKAKSNGFCTKAWIVCAGFSILALIGCGSVAIWYFCIRDTKPKSSAKSTAQSAKNVTAAPPKQKQVAAAEKKKPISAPKPAPPQPPLESGGIAATPHVPSLPAQEAMEKKPKSPKITTNPALHATPMPAMGKGRKSPTPMSHPGQKFDSPKSPKTLKFVKFGGRPVYWDLPHLYGKGGAGTDDAREVDAGNDDAGKGGKGGKGRRGRY